jgi:hypothetical protein
MRSTMGVTIAMSAMAARAGTTASRSTRMFV